MIIKTDDDEQGPEIAAERPVRDKSRRRDGRFRASVGDKDVFLTPPIPPRRCTVTVMQDGAISFVVKTDDSSVSVSADSIDDAIKKINEQIKTLKEKATPEQGERTARCALAKIAKQLEEIARTSKFGDKATNRP